MKKRNWTSEPIALPQGIDHVLVALSGGADSVYLLYALLESGVQVTAAHFHHGLRGHSADGDLWFCREMCSQLEVPLYEGGADVSIYAQQHGVGIETAARELRYRYLRNMRKAVGADVIALGHHMNDQAETVLMHLLRGSGLKGAGGMSELDGDLYRPLLKMTHQQIVERLESEGIHWREDESNDENDNPRNALRNIILPQLTEIYPGAAQALARFSDIAREDGELLDLMADGILHRQVWSLPNGWRVDGIPEIPEALLRRILMRLTGVRDMYQLCSMAKIAKSGRKRAEFTNFRLEPHGENLYIIDAAYRAPEAVPFSCEGATVLKGLCHTLAEPWEPEPELSGGLVQVLSREALEGAELRTRRSGDRIHPLGGPGAKLLSDYLIDRKIPRPKRDVLPLLAKGSDVLWVVGVGIAEDAKVEPGMEAVRICCEMAEHHA